MANKPLVQRATGLAIADELVVTLSVGAPAAVMDELAADVGGDILVRGTASGVFVVRLYDGVAAQAAASVLARRSEVAEVAFNRVLGGSSTGGSGIGTSPGIIKGMQWNFPALQVDPFVGLGAGAGVRVAVLDSGVAYEDYADELGVYAAASDLAGVVFIPGFDFINGDDHPNDDHGHGTHVTGVIAASTGATSLAPGVEVLPVKVLDADNLGTELALAEGIRYAVDNGAHVINMSLSFPPTYFPSRYLQSAIDYASARGVVMIAAVGNHDEDVVTYPAAFRDVIAVGATSIHPWFYPTGGPSTQPPENADRWAWVYWFLERAPYSNRGYAVDVVAPGGRIDRDEDGDGNPEAILAQSFQNDPTELEYLLFAGTSQAAAQVTGIAAVMLRENGQLSPSDVRAVLGESAGPMTLDVLSATAGRGRVTANLAVANAASASATAARPQFRTAIHLAMEKRTTGRRAVARVEVLDASGAPAPLVRVFGSFTGAAFERGAQWTDWDGVATFKSSTFGLDGKVVAFEVDAVGVYSWHPTVDRPSGFARMDSLSVELLAQFAGGLDGAPSDGGTGESTHASSGAGGDAPDTGGAGIGTSPGDSLPNVMDVVPIVIKYTLAPTDPAYLAPDKVVSTLSLTNFSWGQATMPMAVVVEEDWFVAVFPQAVERRVVAFGSGIGTSPIKFDPVLSFPAPLSLPQYEVLPPRINLVLATFSVGSGIGTSPGFRPIFPDVFYGIGIPANSADVDVVLADYWQYHYATVTGSGIGTSPGYVPDLGVTPLEFTHLGNVVESHVVFGLGDDAAPVGAYGSVLEAAGVDLAPVDPRSDGDGIGTSTVTIP